MREHSNGSTPRRYLQSHSGLFAHSFTFAMSVEAPHANAAQDWSIPRLWHGRNVKPLLLNLQDIQQADHHRRICAISVVRIFTIREFAKPSSKKHWSTTIFLDTFLTSVEPSLGVINASIPLFPAVFRAMTGTAWWKRSKSMLSIFTGSTTSSGSSHGKTSKDDQTNDCHNEEKRSNVGSEGALNVDTRKQSEASSVSGPDSFLNTELAGVDMRGMHFSNEALVTQPK